MSVPRRDKHEKILHESIADRQRHANPSDKEYRGVNELKYDVGLQHAKARREEVKKEVFVNVRNGGQGTVMSGVGVTGEACLRSMVSIHAFFLRRLARRYDIQHTRLLSVPASLLAPSHPLTLLLFPNRSTPHP